MELSDQALLRQYASRQDAEAFAQIVRRHAGIVYGACLRVAGNAHDAEDAAQECFLDLARHAGSVTTSLPGWLHVAATNHALMLLRKNATRSQHESRARAIPRANTEPEWSDIAPVIDEALKRLPEADRLPLVLHFLQGKNQEQVAEELGVSQPTISRRIERGVSLLRDQLKKSGVIASAAAVGTLMAQNAATAAPATLYAALGKLALSGIGATSKGALAASASASAGTGGSTAAAALTGGGIAVKIAISALIAATLVTGGVVVHNVLAQKQAPSTATAAAPAPPAQGNLPVTPPAPVVSAPLTAAFGPVIERVVGDPEEQDAKDAFLDLDTGRLLTPPISLLKEAGRTQKAWMAENRVDLWFHIMRREGKPIGGDVNGPEMIIASTPAALWDTLAPSELPVTLARARDARNGPPGAPAVQPILDEDGRGNTYAFQTREGGIGILQIIGFTDNPKGVKIRYKMVSALASMAPVQPAPSLAAKMSEGIAGAGFIRTTMGVYKANHGGEYPTFNDAKGDALGEIGIQAKDLTGKYFGPADYSVTSSPAGCRITARLGPETFTINERGEESGTFKTR